MDDEIIRNRQEFSLKIEKVKPIYLLSGQDAEEEENSPVFKQAKVKFLNDIYSYIVDIFFMQISANHL